MFGHEVGTVTRKVPFPGLARWGAIEPLDPEIAEKVAKNEYHHCPCKISKYFLDTE